MSIITRMRKQKAIWWEKGGVDGYGKPEFNGPIEIDCRWDDEVREFRTPDGEVRISRSVVYLDRDLAVGDMLKLGEVDSDTQDDPYEEDDAIEVRAVAKTPNLKATEYLRIAYL